MNFQMIPKVESADTIIDIAFREAKNAAERVRSTAHGSRLDKSKEVEIARLAASKRVMNRRLDTVLKSFPSFDNINPFYLELLKCYVEVQEVKSSLAGVSWAKNRIEKIFVFNLSRIKRARELNAINAYRREFYGRASSVLKQIKDRLEYLEHTRAIMRKFPVIKEKYFTVAIAGFPNTGKTTLLSKLSGSTPEIREYAFTTKSLNLGYIERDGIKIQLIDTPGTLNRFEKMNDIEKQAYLAIKYCAHAIIYVFDLTEPYPLEEQKKLLSVIKKFEKPVLFYLSKTDLLEKKTQEDFASDYDLLSIPKLKENLFSEAGKWIKLLQELEAGELSEQPPETAELAEDEDCDE